MYFSIEQEAAINVYRTKYYIVIQELALGEDFNSNSMLISEDSYYIRTKKRDSFFNKLFKDRRIIDGKRIRATVYKRRYIK